MKIDTSLEKQRIGRYYIYEEKLKKQRNSKFGEFIMKLDVKRIGYNNLLQNFKFKKSVVEIAMDVGWNSRKKKNTFHKSKVLKKVITTETFNVEFYNDFIKFWITLFFSTFFYTHTHTHTDIYIYIYIYIYLRVSPHEPGVKQSSF